MERRASGVFPHFDARPRGDATRTGIKSPVLFLQSPLDSQIVCNGTIPIFLSFIFL
jgi:hypothetical protein